MGASTWSASSYHNTVTLNATRGISNFDYNDRVLASQPTSEKRVHPNLDPKNINGRRESRDSDAHPESLAIIVAHDITGSMSNCPRISQQKLPELMGGLERSGFAPHPQIMISGFGDAYSDRAILQVGQFESGLEINDDLGRLWLEGGGGGSGEESSELVIWMAANLTSIDCFEKRGRKGYLFIITDERAYEVISKSTLEEVFGDNAEEMGKSSLMEALEKAKEKYHVFVITPGGTSHWQDTTTMQFWRNRVQNNYIRIQKIDYIVDTIVSLIGLTEGLTTPDEIKENLTRLIGSESAKSIYDSIRNVPVGVAAQNTPS